MKLRKDTSLETCVGVRTGRETRPTGPRVIHSANHSLIEQGAWKIKRLRRQHVVELHPWSSPQSLPSAPAEPQRVNRDPLALARLYQGLIDAGIAKNRAEVARYFGVSRARVTQVLRRLDRNGNGHASDDGRDRG